MLTKEKTNFIEFMIRSNVLRFGNFITKSGRNSPYFINTGNYCTGEQITKLGEFYAGLVKEKLGDQFSAMFGPAYKGIPLVTAAAGALFRLYGINKPYFFNRKEAKDHGEGGNVIGYVPKDGDDIIIIEDVMTSGLALRESLPVLQACAKLNVKDMFISVNRCEVGKTAGKTAMHEVREELGIDVHAIVNIKDIYDYLKLHGTDGRLLQTMEAYMERYCVLKP